LGFFPEYPDRFGRTDPKNPKNHRSTDVPSILNSCEICPQRGNQKIKKKLIPPKNWGNVSTLSGRHRPWIPHQQMDFFFSQSFTTTRSR
jgi:hypothetical protein